MTYSSWADRARSDFETRQLFDAAAQQAQFCGDLFFGVVRQRTGAIGTYVEVIDDAKALCPNCLGNGSEQTMKIPKEDWESGASGYALYSCNKVNGREACPVCGGAGGEYLDWYLAEQPELAATGFKAGSGLLRR